MTWNYRLMLHVEDNDDIHEEYLAFHEVYYRKDLSVENWTVEPVSIIRETITGMEECFYSAIKKPILDYGTGNEVEDQEKYRGKEKA